MSSSRNRRAFETRNVPRSRARARVRELTAPLARSFEAAGRRVAPVGALLSARVAELAQPVIMARVEANAVTSCPALHQTPSLTRWSQITGVLASWVSQLPRSWPAERLSQAGMLSRPLRARIRAFSAGFAAAVGGFCPSSSGRDGAGRVIPRSYGGRR